MIDCIDKVGAGFISVTSQCTHDTIWRGRESESIRRVSEEYYQIIANSIILVFCTYYVAVRARPNMRGTVHTKDFPPFTGVGLWLPNHSSLIINLASPAFFCCSPRPKSGLNLEKCASFTVATPLQFAWFACSAWRCFSSSKALLASLMAWLQQNAFS